MRSAVAAAVFSLATPCVASDFVLSQPIDCVLGDTCHIQQFVDRDAGPEARDFFCGGLSYDGHQGTDFSLPTMEDMRLGVNVLAAAPGVVVSIRDGMPDVFFTQDARAQIAGRECGNGVLMRHDDGFETQYCHLKMGSIRVRPGQEVIRGAVLGQVGLSGATQFPHLHLTVRENGQMIDPFDRDTAETCGLPEADLWEKTPLYRSTGLLDVGFSNGIPSYEAVQNGTAAVANLPADAAGLVLFGYAFGGQAGDIVTLTINGPNGNILNQTVTLEKDQARYFRASGKRLTADRWPAGPYLGTVIVMRDGKQLGRRQIVMDVK